MIFSELSWAILMHSLHQLCSIRSITSLEIFNSLRSNWLMKFLWRMITAMYLIKYTVLPKPIVTFLKLSLKDLKRLFLPSVAYRLKNFRTYAPTIRELQNKMWLRLSKTQSISLKRLKMQIKSIKVGQASMMIKLEKLKLTWSNS